MIDMQYSIEPIISGYCKEIIDIFNYYVEHSFAAYPEIPFPYEAFDMLQQRSNSLPTGAIRDDQEKIAGFGMLRPHNPASTFSHTAEIAYFIHPDYTGKGLGTMLLAYLEKYALEQGIINFIAHISSLNPNSVQFHRKNGFVECGRLKKVGRKKDQYFDIIWMQKILRQGNAIYSESELDIHQF